MNFAELPFYVHINLSTSGELQVNDSTTESNVLQIVSLTWQELLHLGFLSCLTLGGLVFNLGLLIVITISPSLHHVSSLPITATSLAYTAICTTLLPARIINMQRTWLHNSSTLCHVTGWAYVMFKTAGVGSVTALLIDRSLNVLKPLHYQGIKARRCIVTMVTVTWILTTTMATLPMLGWGNYDYWPGKQLCAPALRPAWGFTLLTLLLGCITPQCLAVTACLMLTHESWAVATRGNIVCDENHCTHVRNIQAQRRMLIMSSVRAGE